MAIDAQKAENTLVKALSRWSSVVTGTRVDEAVSRLPQVHKVPAFYQGADKITADGVTPQFGHDDRFHFTAQREDGDVVKLLGSVGERYTVVQDEDAFQPLLSLGEQGRISPIALGTCNGGAKHWLLSRWEGDERDTDLGGGDGLRKYLMATNSHDGSSGVNFQGFLLRWACTNGMIAKGTIANFSIRHTESSAMRIAEASEIVTQVWGGLDKILESMRAMMGVTLDKRARAKYIADVLGINVEKELSTRNKNILLQVAQILERGRGATQHSRTKHTVWGVFNAITEYVDHERTVRETKTGNNRLVTNLFGAGSVQKQKAYDRALALVTA